MLEELLAITNIADFESCGSLRLTRVEGSGATLILSLNVSADEYPDIHLRWRIVCSGVREDRLSLGNSHYFELSDDHVLLWPHASRRTLTSFYGRCENPSAVAGALYERHRELAGKWIPFDRFLNPGVRLTKLIDGGFGMLAEGPEPLILAYEDVMRRHGFSTSHHDSEKPRYWDGEEWVEEKAALSVLMLDESYIVAEEFVAEAV
jgi:hypothetical protein